MTEWREAIEKTLALIEDNITEEYTLLDLANQAGYSPFYFSRLFRFVCGTTIRKYIADRRLCRAALDIQNTRERILEIAVKYGFSSADFYKNVLGADIVNHEWYGGPNRIEIWFGERNDNNVCITVHYDEEFKPQTTSSRAFMGGEWNFGFEFRVADADAEYERIREMDVEIKYPPKDVPWGYRYFGIKDPDGNTIDLVLAKK